MSISLVKGQKIDLTKGNAGLNKVVFGLGWDTNRYDGNADFDLDVSAFFTDDSGKVTGEQDFVFYGQPQHPSGALIYSGDNRTGVGDGERQLFFLCGFRVSYRGIHKPCHQIADRHFRLIVRYIVRLKHSGEVRHLQWACLRR